MNKMFNMSRTFLTVGEELYEVLKNTDESHLPLADEWKKYLGADKVFRKEGRLYFCSLIEEAVIIEETVPEKENN